MKRPWLELIRDVLILALIVWAIGFFALNVAELVR